MQCSTDLQNILPSVLWTIICKTCHNPVTRFIENQKKCIVLISWRISKITSKSSIVRPHTLQKWTEIEPWYWSWIYHVRTWFLQLPNLCSKGLMPTSKYILQWISTIWRRQFQSCRYKEKNTSTFFMRMILDGVIYSTREPCIVTMGSYDRGILSFCKRQYNVVYW